MFRAIPKNLWKEPLDFSLQCTREGELLVPFPRHFLQAEPANTTSVAFARFSDLPAELQLRIIGFCDIATLFQLMHTSSCVRAEAEKLFFSGPDAWYCVDADWILRGCYAGDTHYATEFLPHVKQLEIQFRVMDEDFWLSNYHCFGDRPEEKQNRTLQRLEERVRRFWQTVQAIFPRVHQVLLCESYLRTQSELPPSIFNKLALMCSPDMEVSFSFLKARKRRDFRAERSMWRQVKNITDASAVSEWIEIPTQHQQPRVILPNKRFRGPIGAYEYSCYKADLYYQHEYITFVMLTAAVEAHHFDGRHDPFQCPASECDAWFEQPGEYTKHVIEQSEHQRHVSSPAPVKALFSGHEKHLEVLRWECNKAGDTFRELWDTEGTEKRRATERVALHQIENDPLYAQQKPACKSYILNKVLDDLDGIV